MYHQVGRNITIFVRPRKIMSPSGCTLGILFGWGEQIFTSPSQLGDMYHLNLLTKLLRDKQMITAYV